MLQIITSILISLLLLPSCSKVREEKKREELCLNIVQDPLTLDPRKSADFVSTTINFLLFEGLIRVTPHSTVSMALAEKVEISEDRKTYRFFLRDAKWSDGSPITAYDLVNTWKDVLRPEFPSANAHLLFPIKNGEKAKLGQVSSDEIGILALDQRTVQIELEQPTPFFLEMISFCVFSPIHQSLALSNAKWAEEKGAAFVGNGPYRLREWKRGLQIVLEKNPYYWDEKNVTLERIHFSIVDNEMTALKMFEQGELDILGLPFTGIPSDSIPSLQKKGAIKTTSLPGSTICCFNLSAFPFNNVNIRKAFAYAIDRQEIVNNVTQTGEEVGIHLIPQNLVANSSDPYFRDGDIERARQYFQMGLNELGLKAEELGTISMLHASSGIYQKVALALQEQWRKALGVHIKLEGAEYKVFLDKLSKRDYQLGQCVWIAQYHDPMNFFERFKNRENTKNYPGYFNPEYAQLLQESNFATDANERFALLRRAEDIFVDDMPVTAIYHWNNSFVVSPCIENLQHYPSGGFHLCGILLNKKQSNL